MKKTLFFGNGLNRCSKTSKSWDEILKEIKGISILLSGVSNTLQYEDIYLNLNYEDKPKLQKKKSIEWQMKKSLADEIDKTNGNVLFSVIAKMDFDNYITTNYDHLLEKQLVMDVFSLDEKDDHETLYSIMRKKVYSKGEIIKTIWNIHGDIKYPQSMMLGYDHYCGALGKVTSFVKGNYTNTTSNKKIDSMPKRMEIKDKSIISWIDLMFTTDVYIVGFGMDFSEQDIWWILNKRQRFIKEGKINSENKIFYFNIDNKDKKEILESFGVTVKNSEKPKDDDWTKCYEQILDSISKSYKKEIR